MFNEYKKLLSWSEIKKLNSWEELEGLSISQQVYFAVLSTLKALGHWQVWIAIGFLAMCVYLGRKFGAILGIQFWSLNLAGLFGAAVGGSVYSIVHMYEAKKSLRQVMQKNNKGDKA
jgi:hypothetical protein